MEVHRTWQLKNLWRKFGKQCWYCQKQVELADATRDHKVPLSRGGKKGWSNMVLACRECNTSKAAKPYEDFVKDKAPRRGRKW